MELFGIPASLLASQIMIGLINGSFYALLSLGLCIIFGILNIVNFAHGVMYMMGAFFSWMLLNYLGIGYWWALLLAPIGVALVGVVIERTMLRHIYSIDHIYGFLLTYGLAIFIEGVFRVNYSVGGQIYNAPTQLTGALNLGFMYMPIYRGWVIAVSIVMCFATWFLIEKTRLGATLRASISNPELVQALGINVPRLITLTFAFGSALAGFAGVLAAPIYAVSPLMGSTITPIVFAVVVIGGLGSILGAVIGGVSLGVIEGITRAFYPEAAGISIFVIMIIVLTVTESGLGNVSK